MPNNKRQTAKKCRIKDLLNGRYVKREGWEPNFLETSVGRISRLNIIAVIISKEDKTVTVDDKTGQIELRSFDEQNVLENKKIGDIVLIIGRPRVYNDRVYILPEIVKIIENKGWIKVRELELINKTTNNTPVETAKETISVETKTENKIDEIVKKIVELDGGEGVRIDEVIKHFDKVQANNTIGQLIEQGEIFEIKPGIIKAI